MYVCIYIYTYIHTHTCTRTHTHTHTHTHTRHTCFRASAKSLTFWSTSARSATSCFCLIFSLSSIASVLFSFFFAIKKVSSCLTQKKKTRMATDWLDLQSVFHCICFVSLFLNLCIRHVTRCLSGKKQNWDSLRLFLLDIYFVLHYIRFFSVYFFYRCDMTHSYVAYLLFWFWLDLQFILFFFHIFHYIKIKRTWSCWVYLLAWPLV